MMSATKPPRVTKRRAETRANLLNAAYSVFAERGFGATRIDNVCSAAGYTRGAFYSQFESLDEVFLAIALERTTALIDTIDEGFANIAGIATVDELVAGVSTALPLDVEWISLLTEFRSAARRNATFQERFRAERQRAEEHLFAGLKSLPDSAVRKTSDAELTALAHTMLLLFEAAQQDVLMGATSQDALEWLRDTARVVLHEHNRAE